MQEISNFNLYGSLSGFSSNTSPIKTKGGIERTGTADFVKPKMSKQVSDYDTLDYSDEQLFRVLDIGLGESPSVQTETDFACILRDSTKAFNNSPPKDEMRVEIKKPAGKNNTNTE